MNNSPAIAQATTALAALRNNEQVAQILADLTAAQRATENEGTWDTKAGRDVEAAMGYLRMALEASGRRF